MHINDTFINRTSEHRNIGTSEHRNIGTSEHRNIGTIGTSSTRAGRDLRELTAVRHSASLAMSIVDTGSRRCAVIFQRRLRSRRRASRAVITASQPRSAAGSRRSPSRASRAGTRPGPDRRPRSGAPARAAPRWPRTPPTPRSPDRRRARGPRSARQGHPLHLRRPGHDDHDRGPRGVQGPATALTSPPTIHAPSVDPARRRASGYATGWLTILLAGWIRLGQSAAKDRGAAGGRLLDRARTDRRSAWGCGQRALPR
jgi:hypothetical protein